MSKDWADELVKHLSSDSPISAAQAVREAFDKRVHDEFVPTFRVASKWAIQNIVHTKEENK